MSTGKITQGIRDLRTFARIVSAKTFNQRVPIFLYVMLTNRCNLNCIYCLTQCHKQDSTDMPLDKVIKIIDEAYELGTRFISLQGGEPLLRQDIDEIVDYLRNKGVTTELVTNAFFLKKRIKTLEKIDRICISLDGTEGPNDLNRGNGTYKAVMRNIEYALSHGIRFYRIESTFTKNNCTFENFLFLGKLAKRLGCMLTPFAAVLSEFNVSEAFHKVALMDRDDVRRFWTYVKRLGDAGYQIHFSPSIVENALNNDMATDKRYNLEETRRQGLPLCTFGRLSAYIDVQGQMYPCIPMYGLMGRSIYDSGLKGAWEHFGNLDCYYCYIGRCCSFSDITIKNLGHLLSAYARQTRK
jgi:MoaA/NifB/PqqE/SkfB family radical SAM enzyme